MVVENETLQKSENQLHNKVLDRDNFERDMWIMPAPFSAMQ